MNKRNGTFSEKQEAPVIRKTAQRRISIDSIAAISKHLGLKTNQQQPNASTKNSKNTSCSLSATNNQSSVIEVTHQAKTSKLKMPVSCLEQTHLASFLDADHKNKCLLPSASPGCSSSGKGSLKENESLLDVNCTRKLEDYSLPVSFGKRKKQHSRKEKPTKHTLKDDSSSRKTHSKSCGPAEVFDIFQCEADDSMSLRQPQYFSDEVKEPKVDKEPRERVLRPGMILLKSYISDSEQVSIARKCRELGVGPGGFYRPGYKYGAKLRLHMMCLGLDWDPQTREYQKRRLIDKSKPPDIPIEFSELVKRAMLDSLALIRRDYQVSDAEDILPQMNPDICIVNFYSETGRLGLHQIF
ncbi:hypothetical protein SOVF_037660 [Spinacia oleracea]|nr:hypothetical protein SOVF_037660 [Spinacia oleracea]